MIKRYFPLFVFFSFSLATIGLFFFGPIDYAVSNVKTTVGYLICVHLAVFIGYRIGIGQDWGKKKTRVDIQRMAAVCSCVALLYMLAVLRMNAVFGISFDTAIESPGLARGIGAEKIGTFYSYLTSWLEILNISFVCLLFAWWGWLQIWQRFVGCALFLFLIIDAVAMGARHAIWAFLFIAFVALHIAIVAKRIRVSWLLYVSSIAGIASISTVYFSFIALARSGYERSFERYDSGRIGELDASRLMFVGREKIDEDHPLIRLAPAKLSPAILQGYSYLTHGYKALSMALAKPFIGIAWGFGHSAWTTRLGVRLFGDAILKYCYPYRLYMEDDYPLTKWITSYPWIASDVTFPGSILVVGFLGWLLGASWKASITAIDPLATILCCYLSLFFNQMPIIYFAQDPVTALVFYGLICLFLSRKLRWRKVQFAAAPPLTELHGPL